MRNQTFHGDRQQKFGGSIIQMHKFMRPQFSSDSCLGYF